MLSVAPMNLARAAYHEQSLGHGLDDYYSEWGERPGLWWGGGAELLGLAGYAASSLRAAASWNGCCECPGNTIQVIEYKQLLGGAS